MMGSLSEVHHLRRITEHLERIGMLSAHLFSDVTDMFYRKLTSSSSYFTEDSFIYKEREGIPQLWTG